MPTAVPQLEKEIADLRAANAPAGENRSDTETTDRVPDRPEVGRRRLRRTKHSARAPPRRDHTPTVPGKDEAARDTARLNFLGIVFCMMFGTAALPHILMRYYDAKRAAGARFGVLVAVLHFPAVFHRSVLGSAGQIRRVYQPRRQ